MPEHCPNTPAKFRYLESFLWNDFDSDRSHWDAWLRRKSPDGTSVAGVSGFRRALQLHTALRSLQCANSGIDVEKNLSAGHEVLNKLIGIYGIYPHISENGQVALATNAQADPVASLLLIILEALQEGLWRRFKLCHEPSCRASYYDASKAAAKTWCSMELCGSRTKMKRYRLRNSGLTKPE